MPPPLKICFASTELAPLAKSGGLADVAAALPAELLRAGHDARVFLPFYSTVAGAAGEIRPVDVARDVRVELGPRTYAFSVFTTKIATSGVEPYLIDCPELYHRGSIYTDHGDEPQRFVLFSRAVIECCQRLGWAPDVFHCNDWHTALIPLLLRGTYSWDAMFSRSRTLLTVHNLGYQGSFPREIVDVAGLGSCRHLFDQGELAAGRVNFLRAGLAHADWISTVSPTYAREIRTEAFGMGLDGLLRARGDRLVGLLNGVDYTTWSPERDAFIPRPFSRDQIDDKLATKRLVTEKLRLRGTDDAPLAGIISRLVYQKGFDLCYDVLPEALRATPLQLVVLGSGEAQYERFFESLQTRFPDRVCYHRGYHDELAHLITAGSDVILMPSRYEPCGLNQMFAMRYGTLPVARRTGGLADTIQPVDAPSSRGTGFTFDDFTPQGLRGALGYALESYRDRPLWRRLMANAMAQDFSWQQRARPYIALYTKLADRPASA